MTYSYSKHTATCPICGNSDNKLLYKISSDEAAAQCMVVQPAWRKADAQVKAAKSIERLWGGKTASVVGCTKCGVVFADPFVSGDAEFYNVVTHSDNSVDYNKIPLNWKWEFDKTFNTLSSLYKNGQNIQLLEIGASIGDFAIGASKLIPKENILCLEYSEKAVERIKNVGIKAMSDDFRELKDRPEHIAKYDVICLFQVLEHLDRMDDTFETFNKLIKPGGHLFIGVPNDKNIKFNELNGGLLDIPPNHLIRFNKHSFKLLGQKYNWQLKELCVQPYTPLDVMKTVMYSQSLKRSQYPPVERRMLYRTREYLQIKKLRLRSFLLHKQLGECTWVHYQKP
ncbi:class I SAM-dependent methyltransferase [Mucilaginibacter myungsuensis]|uniref:Class I SAM-dependent methyltransferase n=1 Tax=Mucilaginibacter myungsuensis TaxID=649104 RepID=A0A929KUR8_9SPHI|nr:class I SAM-dependent methyltransferase [Mucilaginibacter myungsuensis]MBE9660820.1 class I SAM-dependent methyltransferase [Mucilaginibacter myungsuensis]MDN3600867.1 class I SAM-dependent methyltransferase [Mucilaginibacter myungsuensis]